MPSMIFSDEEARFLRLVLRLAERPHDDKRESWMPFGLDKINAVGEFRILVIGSTGVGKTSILTKVRALTWLGPYMPSAHTTSVLHRHLSRAVNSSHFGLLPRLPAHHHHRLEPLHRRRPGAPRRPPVVARAAAPGPGHHRGRGPRLRHHRPIVANAPQVALEHHLRGAAPAAVLDQRQEAQRLPLQDQLAHARRARGPPLAALPLPAAGHQERRACGPARGRLARGPERRGRVLWPAGRGGRRECRLPRGVGDDGRECRRRVPAARVRGAAE